MKIRIPHILTLIGICVSTTFYFSWKLTRQETQSSRFQEILDLHDLQREIHFKENADEFASLLSSDHISVNRGEIDHPSHEQLKERFSQYFSSVEFEKWDDINPPEIRFSADSSMAYTVVHKNVVVTALDEQGQPQKDSTEFAWVAIYRQFSDGWKIECVASTEKK